jgi:CubicO group peptidase (beta-lactamase class C family)
MNQSLLFAPGTEYLYSNVNFWVLGEPVEQLSGETYEHFVTNEILRPLGMKETTFLVNDTAPGDATGYSYSTTVIRANSRKSRPRTLRPDNGTSAPARSSQRLVTWANTWRLSRTAGCSALPCI